MKLLDNYRLFRKQVSNKCHFHITDVKEEINQKIVFAMF